MDSVRIDKWLWACRFFKTRNLAKQEIDGGKVKISGQKIKPSREIKIGDLVQLRQGWDDKEVVVEAISDQRRGAPEAQKLYTETAASIAKREAVAEQRKLANAGQSMPESRPSKKQRRQIHRFKQDNLL